MPECTAHNLNCRCGLVAIPVPASEEERPESEEQLACGHCGEPETDCCCSICSNCDERVEAVCDRCARCDECCSAVGGCFCCDNCDCTRNAEHRCSNCDYCDHCCECFGCRNCGDRVDGDDFCGVCDRCTSCCRCEDEDEERCHCERLEGSDEFHIAKRNQHKRNPSKRFVAAEIEVAALEDTSRNGRICTACRKWGAAIVPDRSLPDTGFEINTAPASGDLFTSQVEEIGMALRQCGAKVNSACGLHVHIDARDFGYWEVRRLIRLYALVEDALFSLVSESRQRNTYCGRCGAEYLQAVESGNVRKIKDRVCQAVYKDTDIKDRRKHKYEFARYKALNLHSWFYRGTVECRLFDGTTDAAKVINWGMLWAGILDWVYSHRDKDIDALKGQDGFTILKAVAPTEEVRKWLEDRRAKFVSEG